MEMEGTAYPIPAFSAGIWMDGPLFGLFKQPVPDGLQLVSVIEGGHVLTRGAVSGSAVGGGGIFSGEGTVVITAEFIDGVNDVTSIVSKF